MLVLGSKDHVLMNHNVKQSYTKRSNVVFVIRRDWGRSGMHRKEKKEKECCVSIQTGLGTEWEVKKGMLWEGMLC